MRLLKLIVAVGGFLFVLVSLFQKKGERMKGVAFLAGWLVPGAGHVLLGKWKKGLFFFTILGATYLFGMWISGFRPVSFDDNPFYFVGQYGSGLTLLIAKLRGAQKAIIRPGLDPSWFDPGLLYVCVVGLLNLVVMLSLVDAKALGGEEPATPAGLEASALPAVPTVGAPASAPEKPA
ncbi:MAG TPA: DUF6677 family protein [Planctomycetota bacterium]|nr:DUF6677 family protein [Planctomycetota bacterium]